MNLSQITTARVFRWLSRAVMVAFMFCLYALNVASQTAFPLHTSGRYIVDSNGARVHLNGANWAGAESSDFVVAGLQVATLSSIVQQMKSIGFNVVRLPWSNQLYETNPVVGNYALAANPSLQGENALTILDQVIAALTNAGIMVILDNHNSNAEWCCSTTDGNTLWYNRQYPQTSWIADWQGMAQRYQSNPLVIGADLRNEPRGSATWGGSSSTDWHSAAQLAGNAVLSINPNLLVVVEGVNYAGDLSGVANLPVQLNVANHLVYEAHDYGFWYSGFTNYANYVNTITPKWGYLVSGANPQPLWVGEFGTCDTADTCVNGGNSSDGGYWFSAMTSFVRDYSVDWSYWSINGTQSTGSGRSYGAPETYGVLNPTWNGSALASLTVRLQSMMNPPANLGFNLIPAAGGMTVPPGGTVSAVLTIVPAGGFTGTVNLSCSVSEPGGAVDLPQCSVPASVAMSGPAPTNATVSITTTAAVARNVPGAGAPNNSSRPAKAFALAGAVLLLGNLRRRRKSFLVVATMFVASFAIAACGASRGGSSMPVTAAGTYTVTVTGAASGLTSVGAQISVTVQ